MFTLDIYMTYTERIMQKHNIIFDLICNEYSSHLLEHSVDNGTFSWNDFKVTTVAWNIKHKYPNANIPEVTYKTLFGPTYKNRELSIDLYELTTLNNQMLEQITELFHQEYLLEEHKDMHGIKTLIMDKIEDTKKRIKHILKEFNELYVKLKRKYHIRHRKL